MDQNAVSGLPGTALRAGIIVGAIGAFTVIIAPQIMQSQQFGPAHSQALGMVGGKEREITTHDAGTQGECRRRDRRRVQEKPQDLRGG